MRSGQAEGEIRNNQVIGCLGKKVGENGAAFRFAIGTVGAQAKGDGDETARGGQMDAAGTDAGNGAGYARETSQGNPLEVGKRQTPGAAVFFVELSTAREDEQVLGAKNAIAFKGVGEFAAADS